ncbi:MAG: hypothetical protein QOF37_1933 [Thermoleophilaceae bacterium]|jgi:hypothetical protein|nr:hypothetical protein [Thermoleophilaceae bacterium]
MQHTLIHLEYARVMAATRAEALAPGRPRVSHPPPRAPRRHAAELLARAAWRLDREAALRVWP